VVGRLGHLNGTADIGDGLALGDQLLSGFELADDLLGCVADAFYCEVPGPVWPDEDSHSPWTDVRGPRQFLMPRSGLVLYILQPSLHDPLSFSFDLR